MSKKPARQYTIRNIPDSVDRVLRQRARRQEKSFNQVALEAIMVGSGEAGDRRTDLDFMIGSVSKKEAKTISKEIQRQHQIDEDMWK